MTLPEFYAALTRHLHYAGVAFDRGELIEFVEANRHAIAEAPDVVAWATTFAEAQRERQARQREQLAALREMAEGFGRMPEGMAVPVADENAGFRLDAE